MSTSAGKIPSDANHRPSVSSSLESKSQKLERLIELAFILSQQNDFQEILRVLAQKAASLLDAESATIMMINPRTRQTIKTIFKEGHESRRRKHHAVQTQVSGWMLVREQSFSSTDIKTDPRFAKNLFDNSNVRSVLGVPLRVEGITIGTLILLNIRGDQSFEKALVYLEQLATIAAPFLRNVQKIQAYFSTSMPEAALIQKYRKVGLIGRSRVFVELLQAVEAAARCDVRVLLEGQSGTGKELVARAIHRFSSRSDQHFVAIDCGAIPESLIESELFGHIKGAFTGATVDRKGLLIEADHGTLFMDEIANLPLAMQAKLMRFLQEGEVRPLGSDKTHRVNVRIISASSNSLHKMVESGLFRDDLYYRLHVYPIQVPSLDERHEDTPLLANHFLKNFSTQQKKQAESFHEEVLDFMQQRHWAGNIRELENFVERLVTTASSEIKILDRDLLPKEMRRELRKFDRAQSRQPAIKSLSESVSEFEKDLIRQALSAYNWNQTKTARALKISEPTLRYKMGKLGIVRRKET